MDTVYSNVWELHCMTDITDIQKFVAIKEIEYKTKILEVKFDLYFWSFHSKIAVFQKGGR